MNNWADLFWKKAFKHTMQSELSEALPYIAAALGVVPDDERSWRLAGLCYYQLGNYRMAGDCIEHLTDGYEELKLSLRQKQEEMNIVNTLIRQAAYKKAAKYLMTIEKNVSQWNCLGCQGNRIRKFALPKIIW